jgi:hypothetical protein
MNRREFISLLGGSGVAARGAREPLTGGHMAIVTADESPGVGT